MTGKAAELDVKMLRAWREKAHSGLGGVNPDQSVTLAGHDLFSQLVGNLSPAACFHLYVKKCLPSPQVERLLAAIITATVYPDIRIWPNRAVAYCAVSGTGNAAGIAGGMLGMEGQMFGGECVARCYAFLARLKESEAGGKNLESLIDGLATEQNKIPGFGRPLVQGDERLKPILRVAQECGLADGEWLAFGRRVEKMLDDRYKIRFNVAALMACLLADMGFSHSEAQSFGSFTPVISFYGVFHEHSRPDAGPVFPLSVKDVLYTGEKPVLNGERKDYP